MHECDMTNVFFIAFFTVLGILEVIFVVFFTALNILEVIVCDLRWFKVI